MCHEIIHHRLRPALGEPPVVFGRALVVAMCAQLYRHVGVLVQQGHQLVQRPCALWAEGGFVEVVENVIYQHWSRYGGEGELQGVLRGLLHSSWGQFLLMVEEAGACRHDEIVDSRLHRLGETPIGPDADFLVRPVIAHDIDLCLLQFVSVPLIDPSPHGL